MNTILAHKLQIPGGRLLNNFRLFGKEGQASNRPASVSDSSRGRQTNNIYTLKLPFNITQ